MILALACSCSRQSSSLERFAFLPFDNQTGDPALEWVRTAGPQIAAQQLSGLKDIVAFPAADLRDAQLRNATRFVHGVIDRRAQSGRRVHLEIAIEDPADRRMRRTSSFDGDVLAVTAELAKYIHSGAKPFSTASPAALEAWGSGDLDRAISLDPDFGAAWLAKIQKLTVARDGPGAMAAVDAALRRNTLRTPLDRVQIELASATLRNDPKARTQALATLTGLLPNDTQLIRTLADAEVAARRFSEAARLYEQLSRLPSPAPDIFNQLGYAYAFAGDVARARKAFEDYSRQPGQEANSIDSLGEALFMNGQFAEAEKKFLEAHDRSPEMLSGGDVSKAAYARWLGGDLKGADELYARYVEFRKMANDPLIAWRAATWLYATGRKDRAIERLQVNRSSNPQLTAITDKQLAVWRASNIQMPKDLGTLKQLYEATPPFEDGLIRIFYAEALLEAGNREEARKLTERWPLPEPKVDVALQSLLYPRFLELRRKVQ